MENENKVFGNKPTEVKKEEPKKVQNSGCLLNRLDAQNVEDRWQVEILCVLSVLRRGISWMIRY